MLLGCQHIRGYSLRNAFVWPALFENLRIFLFFHQLLSGALVSAF